AKQGHGDAAKAIDRYLKGGFGTGFVYVAPDGANYLITNHHVIAQADKLSVTFEKLDGAKTTYDRLRVIAADEDIDIALLAFADDVRPFPAGLSFVSAPAEEGSDVYAAGFPGLGNAAVWQFSRGMVSNAAVRLPVEDDEDVPEAALGPYIQHTAQIDPGNSGGPLLIQREGVAAGYAVAGINTLSARRRQAANYAISVNRAQEFITQALVPADPVKDRAKLDAQLESFIKGLGAPKTVYPHIARYLSNACTASNAEYALSEVSDRAPKTVQQRIYDSLDYPLDGMNDAVA
ncbi:MAG: serine protease, partial [Spirochaetaceae bacterium]|nr:serine protease [Spirochaetaceae bacterium]